MISAINAAIESVMVARILKGLVMKQIRAALVLSIIPLLSFAFQADPNAPAKEGSKLPVTGSFSVNLLNGDAVEHVYDYETMDGRRRQLSRLDWDLSEIFMAGGEISARVAPKVTINAGLWLALTEGSGEMDNYDWLDYASTEPTHYSLSEVDVTEGYAIDVNATVDLLQRESITLRGVAGYKQNGWTWTDRGVFALYPEFGPRPIDLEGENLIDYEQEFRIPYIGAQAAMAVQSVAVSMYANYSPIVEANDWDHHIARTIKFKESFEGGEMFGLGARADYPLSERLSAFAAIDYQVIDLIIGDMEALDYSTGEFFAEKDIAGIENEYVAFSLGLGYRF